MNRQWKKEGETLRLILLAHFPQHHMGIVKSKVLAWIFIVRYLTQKGRSEIYKFIGEVVNSDGVNSIGHKIKNLLLWFLR